VVPLLFHPHTSTALFHSITLGLELMVVNFALTTEERTSLARTAASRYWYNCMAVAPKHSLRHIL